MAEQENKKPTTKPKTEPEVGDLGPGGGLLMEGHLIKFEQRFVDLPIERKFGVERRIRVPASRIVGVTYSEIVEVPELINDWVDDGKGNLVEGQVVKMMPVTEANWAMHQKSNGKLGPAEVVGVRVREVHIEGLGRMIPSNLEFPTMEAFEAWQQNGYEVIA